MSIDKISRTLVSFPSARLRVRVHVRLSTKRDNGDIVSYHQEYKFGGNEYLSIDTFPILTLEMTKSDDSEWSADKNVMLSQKNLFSVIQAFKKVLKAIYKEDIFAYNDKELIAYKDEVDKYTEKVYNLGGNQRMIIRPAVVFNVNDEAFEGVNIFLNNTYNVVNMTIDDFECLIYNLEKVDLFAYSQLLLNYYMYSRIQKGNMPETPKYKSKPKIDFTPDSTVSSVYKPTDDSPF